MRLAVACNRSNRYQSGSDSPDDEFEEFDSPETVESIARTIRECGHTVDILEADHTFPAELKRGRYDFVFNIAEGLKGRSRESQVPAVCEMLGVPYSGSDAITLGITLDKDLAKRVLKGAVPLPKGRVFKTFNEIDFSGFEFPIFVKPNTEGSSKGIRNSSRLTSVKGAKKRTIELMNEYKGPVLVEEFLPGMECTIGLIGNDKPRIIGIMEIAPKSVPPDKFIYSLETKRDYLNQVEYHIPARVPKKTLAKISKIAVDAFKMLECRDFARVDIRLDRKGSPKFLEVNPLPGLSPIKGDLVILSKAAGVDYHDLISEILDNSFSRNGLK